MEDTGKHTGAEASQDGRSDLALARVIRRAAESADLLLRNPATPAAVVAAASDASAVCRAASQLVLNGSALAQDLMRAAFGSLATLHTACSAQLNRTPTCFATRDCLEQATACQELYLRAYMRARGFACASKVR